MNPRPEPSVCWQLWVDASFYICRRVGAAGIVLMDAQGQVTKYRQPLAHVSSAVEAEHAALLLGLGMALARGATALEVYSDATINAHAYLSTRGRALDKVRPRYRPFKQLADQFEWLRVTKVPRAEVALADDIAGGSGDAEGQVRPLPVSQLCGLLGFWPESVALLRRCA